MFTFTDWYATLWDKIDVDFLVEETKKLTKDIKQLNKAVRNYEVYRCVLQQLKAVACHCIQAAPAQVGQPPWACLLPLQQDTLRSQHV